MSFDLVIVLYKLIIIVKERLIVVFYLISAFWVCYIWYDLKANYQVFWLDDVCIEAILVFKAQVIIRWRIVKFIIKNEASHLDYDEEPSDHPDYDTPAAAAPRAVAVFAFVIKLRKGAKLVLIRYPRIYSFHFSNYQYLYL